MHKLMYPGNYQWDPGRTYQFHNTNRLFELFRLGTVDGEPLSIQTIQHIHPQVRLALANYHLERLNKRWLANYLDALDLLPSDRDWISLHLHELSLLH